MGKFMTYYPMPHAFSRHEVELATTIARQVGFSLQRAQAERRKAQAEEELRESEERLWLLSELAPVMIWMGDAAGDCLQLNRALREFWGLPDDPAASAGFDWRETVHPDDREALQAALAEALRAATPRCDRARYRRARGDYRVLETEARPRLSARGRAPRHDRRQHRHHRARGGRGAAGAPARRARPPGQEHPRRGAGARAPDLPAGRGAGGGQGVRGSPGGARRRPRPLDPGELDSAPLARLAHDALRADDEGGARVTLSGPEVLLPPKQAVALTLALHELYTNALKYGALSNEEGCVALNWRQTGDALRLAWTEAGGPPVAPPGRRGFGSVLIERALAHDCDATVRLEYLPAGLSCTIEMPLPPAGR